MSTLTDIRTIMSEAHQNACDLLALTCDVYEGGTLVVASLKCLRRRMTKQEASILSARGISCDLMLEIPKQTGFTTIIKPKVHNVVVQTVRYEITSVTLGTLISDSNGESPDAPVITLTLVRPSSGGIGEGPGM